MNEYKYLFIKYYKMLNTFLLTSVGGVCGGVIYFVSEDLYKIYITKERKYVRKFELNNILNPGFLFGIYIGGLRCYHGKPILDVLL